MNKYLEQNREKVKHLVENKSFDMFIMMLICLDAVIFGLMTSEHLSNGFVNVLFTLDRLCMAIFIVEMLLKLYVYSIGFFKSKWNVFDFTVITVSSFSFASYFIVLRTFRLFRLLKYINKFSKLKRIINIFSTLLPNFVAFSLVFAVFLYVFAIISTSLYGNVFIEFSTLSSAVFSLMQVFTLDGWASAIARPVMSVFEYSWVFFTSFLLISFLLILSFVMSVIDEIIKKDLKVEQTEKTSITKTKKVVRTKKKSEKNNQKAS